MGDIVDLSRASKKVSSLEPKNKSGQARVQFFSHSTVLLTSLEGKKIIVDPWLEGNPTLPEELKTLDRLDAIALTHGHADHASSAVKLAVETGAQVFAVYELANLLVADGVPESQVCPMGKGGCASLADSGLHLYLTHAIHSSSYQTKDGSTHYAGEPCGVVLELEDERSVYHAGDTCLFSDMKLIGEKFRPDVAFLPIGDRFTMNPAEAAIAAEYVNPAIAVPVHYGTFELLTGSPDDFVRHLRGKDITAKVLGYGQELGL